jgi:hypothetical protein
MMNATLKRQIKIIPRINLGRSARCLGVSSFFQIKMSKTLYDDKNDTTVRWKLDLLVARR